MTILWVSLAVVSTFVMCLAFYGTGLRQGRREGIAEAKLWRQPR